MFTSDLICFMPIVLCNILAAKVPLFCRNPKTGEEEKAFAAVTMAVQALLIAAVLVLMGKPDAPVLHLIYVLLGLVLVCTNTYNLLIRKDGDWWGNLRGVKAAAVCIGRTALLWGARVRERCDRHCDCVLLYRGGISGGNADEEKI